MRELSGRVWIERFPASKRISDLSPSFRFKVENFLESLRNGGATYSVAATYRPHERAYLMHWSSLVAFGKIDPENVPTMPGVNIDWAHRDTAGNVDTHESRSAAKSMMHGYGIVFPAALTSMHTKRNAIDMTIKNYRHKNFMDGEGKIMSIGSDADLYKLGKSFGVIKLLKDKPYWSSNGR